MIEEDRITPDLPVISFNAKDRRSTKPSDFVKTAPVERGYTEAGPPAVRNVTTVSQREIAVVAIEF